MSIQEILSHVCYVLSVILIAASRGLANATPECNFALAPFLMWMGIGSLIYSFFWVAMTPDTSKKVEQPRNVGVDVV